MADTPERPILHHQEILKLFDFLRWWLTAILGISKLTILTAMHFRDTFRFIMLYFVKIGRTVAEISHLFKFR